MQKIVCLLIFTENRTASAGKTGQMIKLDYRETLQFVSPEDLEHYGELAVRANETLESGTGAGNEFLGWLHLPSAMGSGGIEHIVAAAGSLRSRAEVIIVIGIGGSYLGSKAVISALENHFRQLKESQAVSEVVFAGHNLSEDYIWELMDAVKGRSIGVVVISKSGTTIEPAVAFRIVKSEIEKRYGIEGARERIVVVTDPSRGALKELTDDKGYDVFPIPENVGGRFSVFTAAGLLPMAAAGVDIGELLRGATDMEKAVGASVSFESNPAVQYAAVRNALYEKGFKIEILASYEPKLRYITEWWKQLFGESEGKEGKGIFPASVGYTTDLHSLGQYIQDGERIIFETVLSVGRPVHEVVIGADQGNPDGLGYVEGRRVGEINHVAEKGVAKAHVEGGVPNLRIELPEISEYWLGALLYFFERACGISACVLGVNPFDQPGVEAYKKNMFRMLGKPES